MCTRKVEQQYCALHFNDVTTLCQWTSLVLEHKMNWIRYTWSGKVHWPVHLLFCSMLKSGQIFMGIIYGRKTRSAKISWSRGIVFPGTQSASLLLSHVMINQWQTKSTQIKIISEGTASTSKYWVPRKKPSLAQSNWMGKPSTSSSVIKGSHMDLLWKVERIAKRHWVKRKAQLSLSRPSSAPAAIHPSGQMAISAIN